MKLLRSLTLGLAKLAAVIAACGVYDVSRNRNLTRDVLKRYFTGNGVFTWLVSPLNTLMDLLALPYVNKGVWRLNDLPTDCRDEIQRLIDAAYKEDLIGQIEAKARDREKTMLFFKWYGGNVPGDIHIPAYHEPYRYVQTIGVSVFNKRQSTTRHFGPFRATLRVLYNLNDMPDDSAYIVVGDVTQYWRENKLFIFDDTLLHQSFNQTDAVRYCLFVDIVRPSLIPGAFAAVVRAAGAVLRGVNGVFYKSWDVIKA